MDLENIAATDPTTTPIKITESEQKFLDAWEISMQRTNGRGDATWCAKQAYNCVDNRSAGVIGSRLVKRFGLRRRVKLEEKSGFDEEKMKEAADTRVSGGLHGRQQVLQELVSKGDLSFLELFQEMKKIAMYSKDQRSQIPALVHLKSWWEEAQEILTKTSMAERDVVDLLIDALTAIPREKYIEVLKMVRERRLELIHKRNMQIDVEAIIKDEQAKKGFTGTEAIKLSPDTGDAESDTSLKGEN
jgi:hypothetical protein